MDCLVLSFGFQEKDCFQQCTANRSLIEKSDMPC
jgi:hypothetical protein